MLNWFYMQRNGSDAAGRANGFRMPFYILFGKQNDAKRFVIPCRPSRYTGTNNLEVLYTDGTYRRYRSAP